MSRHLPGRQSFLEFTEAQIPVIEQLRREIRIAKSSYLRIVNPTPKTQDEPATT